MTAVTLSSSNCNVQGIRHLFVIGSTCGRRTTVSDMTDPPELPRREPVVAVLLAAGGGSRFLASPTGSAAAPHKLLAVLDDRPVYRWSLDHVLDAKRSGAVHAVVVVTGAVVLELPDDVVEVRNPDWARGQTGSVLAGLLAAAELGAEFAVIGLADQPGVPAGAWERVATAPPTWRIVVASYDGRRGPNPVRLHRSLWGELPSDGDHGARTLISSRPTDVLDVSCPGTAHDIDTTEDLARWKSS
jgi:CTP:molybdopterin cytidylyltransferase MocA